MKLRTLKMGLAALFAGAIGTMTANAGLVPSDASATPEGSNYRYTYMVSLEGDNAFLKSGNSFVIYDFNGFVPGSATAPSSDWSFSTQMTGGPSVRTVANDNPSMPNLIWTYNGSDTLSNGAIGDFTALSTLPEAAVDTDFSGRSLTEDPRTGNLINYDVITSTKGPSGNNPPPDDDGPGDTPGVPEPTTLLLLAAGLPVVVGARYLRHRRRAQA